MRYLPTPNEYSSYWYIDVETELIPVEGPSGVKKVWMMCASRMDQEEVHSFIGPKEIRRFFDELRGQKDIYFVGHNSISFDGPVTGRLCGGLAKLGNIVDTLVLSYLYDPALPGGHSLEAWGERLKDPKGHFNDFSGYSELMDRYCQQDVKLGKRVFKALVQRLLRIGCSELACEIEHEIRDVIDEQQRNGWHFDIPGAQSLVGHLRSEQADLEGPIRELFPKRLAEVKRYDRRFRKDGSDFESYLRHLREYPEVRDNGDGTYSTLDWEEFNIGSPKQRISRLLEAGYEPISFTPTGQPKVDEESLLAYAESSQTPEAKAIAEWLVLQGRATMVEGWLNNVNYDDSRMHGRVITCGATTRRMIHNSPNTANIPKAKPKIKYGIECRRLWRATPGRVQVGADASGLELRMFAEYLNDPMATKLYTEGDPHAYNTELLELPLEMRDVTVKNGLYCLLYGGQNPKLGKTLKPELQGNAAKAYGKWARNKLEAGVPGLKRLTTEIQDEFDRNGGVLKTIDGGFVRCPSKHAALNYKLQSGGAILMKLAAILARRKIRRLMLDAFEIGNIHDELQYDCHPNIADQVGKILVNSIEQAGVQLGCKVPFTGKYKVGNNWAECH